MDAGQELLGKTRSRCLLERRMSPLEELMVHQGLGVKSRTPFSFVLRACSMIISDVCRNESGAQWQKRKAGTRRIRCVRCGSSLSGAFLYRLVGPGWC